MQADFLDQIQIPCCGQRDTAREERGLDIISFIVMREMMESYRVSLTLVPFLKNSPLAPFGPSVVLTDGIPCCGRETVRQKSAPASRDTCEELLISEKGNK
jgi:hypothetical protein